MAREAKDGGLTKGLDVDYQGLEKTREIMTELNQEKQFRNRLLEWRNTGYSLRSYASILLFLLVLAIYNGENLHFPPLIFNIIYSGAALLLIFVIGYILYGGYLFISESYTGSMITKHQDGKTWKQPRIRKPFAIAFFIMVVLPFVAGFGLMLYMFFKYVILSQYFM